MTQYQDGAAFRRALEDRLRLRSRETDIPLARLRKMVAFDRFLVRLIQFQPDRWILKGGLAIQLLLVSKARTTKDIDLLILDDRQDILSSLRSAGSLNLADWFRFDIEQSQDQTFNGFGGLRFHILSLLDSRTFEGFHLDIGFGDPVTDPIEYLKGSSLLDFSGIQPTCIPCYPVTQQIAEKLHAYTRPHVSGVSSRVKDFVDIILLAESGKIEANRLQRAIQATFDVRQTHPTPREVPAPPSDWAKPFRKLAADVSLDCQNVDEATSMIKRFLDPLLIGENIQLWDPVRWSWR